MAFQPLTQPLNLEACGLLEEYLRKPPPFHLSLDIYSRGMGTTPADPLAPYTVLQDPMISVLNPTLIAYITDMASRQIQQ